MATDQVRTPARASGATTTRRALKDRVRVLLAACAVLGLGAVGTLAAWTDTSTVTSGTFSTGTVDLKIGTTTGNAVDTNPSTFTTGLTLTTMAPGASKSQTLVVVNSGTVAFGYTIAGTATNNGTGSDQLGSGMALNVYAGSACTGTPLNSTGRFTFNATASRALAAGANETLCFLATLPSSADSALQNQTTAATFTFTATNS